MKSLEIAFAIIAFALLSSFTTPGEGENPTPAPDGSETQVQFYIQLATYNDFVPAEDEKYFNEIGATQMESKGKTVYVTPAFDTEHDASLKLPEYKSMGYKGAKKVVILENYIVPATVYHFFYDKKKCSAADKNKLFQTEYRVLD